MSTALLMRGLVGEPMPDTPRARALWACRHLRATRAWLSPGSYGWWLYTGDLKRAQRRLLDLRRPR
jgi:hypothetical protein